MEREIKRDIEMVEMVARPKSASSCIVEPGRPHPIKT
jgi:hypothetical protein